MGAFKYSIVRYVPDPVRDERLNVGVVLARSEPHQIVGRFLAGRQLVRLHRFAATDDLSFIRDLAEEIDRSAEGRLDSGPWTLEKLEDAAVGWANTIQFSRPKLSPTEQPLQLLDELFERFVADPRRRTRTKTRSHPDVRRELRRSLASQLSILVPEAQLDAVIATDARATEVRGKIDPEPHRFDFALMNGQVQRYVQALSLELADPRVVHGNIRELAWALDDIRMNDIKEPVSVVTFGPTEQAFETARTLFSPFDAEVVPEGELQAWASTVAHELAAALAAQTGSLGHGVSA